jgi:hypothetical protein
MAIVDYDGFDIFGGTGAAPGLLMEYNLVGGGTGVATGLIAGRFGGQALQLQGGGANQWGGYQRAFQGGATYSTGTVRWAQMQTLLTASLGEPALTLFSGTQKMVSARINLSNGWDILIGTTVVASSANSIVINGTWYSMELEFLISDTVGFVRLYVEGNATPVASFGGTSGAGNADTKPSTQTTVDQIRWSAGGNAIGHTPIIDDWSLDDTTGARKQYRCRILPPTADTAVKAWTPSTGVLNYACVDEVPAAVADYVSASNVADADEYDLTDITSNPSEIAAVKAILIGQKTDAAARNVYAGIDSGGTDSNGTAFALLSSVSKFNRIMTVDPTDSNPWTKAKVNALKQRLEVAP